MSLDEVNNTNELQKVWDLPVPESEGTPLYGILATLATENQRIDVVLDELYDDRFLNTATGRELELIGHYVDVRRNTGESDPQLRARIAAEFGAKSSNTTFESFAKICLTVLNANSGDVTLVTPPESGSKTVNVEVDGAVLDESEFTSSEMESMLDRSLSAGASVSILETGTFAFDGDDESLEGFNEGTWSSSEV